MESEVNERKSLKRGSFLLFKAVSEMTDLDAVSIYAVINLALWQMAMWAYFGEEDDE